jgi:hypothetical protein
MSDIVELPDKESRQEQCGEVWTQFNAIRKSKHLLEYEELEGIIEAYFISIPSIFSVINKEKLEGETIKLISKIIVELDNEKVALGLKKFPNFVEWMTQYYLYHEDNSLISGFRGSSLHDHSKFAIFIHKDQWQLQVNSFGEAKAKSFHCHIVIHESMHLKSYKAKGFSLWDSSKITNHPAQSKLDEGFTELFARLIVYRLQAGVKSGIYTLPANEMPLILLHEYKGIFIPVYEPLKEIALHLSNTLGIQLCADTYFQGQFEKFNESLLSNDSMYVNQNFWKPLSQISHSVKVFCHQDNRINELAEAGLTLSHPTQIGSALSQDVWVDPLLDYFIKIGKL